MTDPLRTSKPTRFLRKRRWLRSGMIGLCLLAVGLLAAVPPALGTPMGRRWLMTRANAAMAPSSLSFTELRLSWWGPTEIRDLVLHDPAGDRVLETASATWDRCLWQILFDRPRYGRLDLGHAAFDVERSEDGSIDLAQTLRILLVPNRETDLAIEAHDGNVRFRSPELAEPVASGLDRLTLRIAPAPGAVTWDLSLRGRENAAESPAFRIRGSYDRWQARSPGAEDLTVGLVTELWPVDLRLGGTKLRLSLSGSLALGHGPEGWSIRGPSRLTDVVAADPALGERPLAMDWLAGDLDVVRNADGWHVRAFDWRSPLGTLKVEGEGEGRRLVASADWNSLRRSFPDVFTVPADLDLAVDTIKVGVRLPLDPDGILADPLGRLDASVRIDGLTASYAGLRLEPTEVQGRISQGSLKIEPIRTTLNGGTLVLAPELVRDETAGWTVRLGPETLLKDAEVNEEMSRRVLSFVAPVLQDATRVTGRVSAAVNKAEYRLGAEPGRRLNMTGAVVFQDVEFAPGPLSESLLGLVGRTDLAALKLDQPVILSIDEDRIKQTGLALPIGNLTRIEIDGTVGFDRSLALNASLPITSKMLGNLPALENIAAGARVSVPIGGTLSRPRVDGAAFRANLADLGRELAERGAVTGALGLIRALTKPRTNNIDPATPTPPLPPRLTPQERKAQQAAKKLERQRKRREKVG